jgi:outer membrane protein
MRRWGAALSLLAGLATAAPAGAVDLGALLHPAYGGDPLHVVPPLLHTGSVLPGDARPVPCAQAQRDFTPELSLADAVDIALCGNPTVQAAWAGIKVEASTVGQAKAAYLPTINAAVSGLSDHTWYPDGGGADSMDKGVKANASLVWRLLDFGERDANLAASRELLAAAVATHDATLQTTMASVIQAYFDAETAQAAWVARQQEESIAASTLETAQRKNATGAGSENDVLQAQTRLAHARLDVSRATGSLGKAKAVVAYALGAPPGTQRGALHVPLDRDVRFVPSSLGIYWQLGGSRQRQPEARLRI